MHEPIFLLGSPQSGTSLIAGLLYHSCGVHFGRVLAPTAADPTGSYQSASVSEAHRRLLQQMERDWTCPPDRFDPGAFDLTPLGACAIELASTSGTWALNDHSLTFLLPAWASVGCDRAFLIAAVRSPTANALDLSQRHGIPVHHAERLVEAHLERLAAISRSAPLSVIEISPDLEHVAEQVNQVAEQLSLSWDQRAALRFMDAGHEISALSHSDDSKAFRDLIESSTTIVPAPAQLASLPKPTPRIPPLGHCFGPRYRQQLNELWGFVPSRLTRPVVLEVTETGAVEASPERPRVRRLTRTQGVSADDVGIAAARNEMRPDLVLVNGVFAQSGATDLEPALRAIHLSTPPIAYLIFDVFQPTSDRITPELPLLQRGLTESEAHTGAVAAGWRHLSTVRLSAGRVGLLFQKHVTIAPSTGELVAERGALVERIATLEAALERQNASPSSPNLLTRPEVELARLRSRRSVRVALSLAELCRPLYRVVRSWRSRLLRDRRR